MISNCEPVPSACQGRDHLERAFSWQGRGVGWASDGGWLDEVCNQGRPTSRSTSTTPPCVGGGCQRARHQIILGVIKR